MPIQYSNGLLFDTNILIDYLNGVNKAIDTLENQTNPKISHITWIEVMVGTNEITKEIAEKFLKQFKVIELTDVIAKTTVTIRQNYRIKLPDAIIWATAQTENTILVTRNTKDFSSSFDDVIIPYTLHPKE